MIGPVFDPAGMRAELAKVLERDGNYALPPQKRVRLLPGWQYAFGTALILVILAVAVLVQTTRLDQARLDKKTIVDYLSERCTRDERGRITCRESTAPLLLGEK